ncbi:hypothetical protein QUA41_06290 [Microcoleus sp. Pol11C1]|uniref:hypothetical protein n=1 Tax=unclassified Microcoleus TaxID=2642155 RepID=UPI002FD6D6A5
MIRIEVPATIRGMRGGSGLCGKPKIKRFSGWLLTPMGYTQYHSQPAQSPAIASLHSLTLAMAQLNLFVPTYSMKPR